MCNHAWLHKLWTRLQKLQHYSYINISWNWQVLNVNVIFYCKKKDKKNSWCYTPTQWRNGMKTIIILTLIYGFLIPNYCNHNKLVTPTVTASKTTVNSDCIHHPISQTPLVRRRYNNVTLSTRIATRRREEWADNGGKNGKPDQRLHLAPPLRPFVILILIPQSIHWSFATNCNILCN